MNYKAKRWGLVIFSLVLFLNQARSADGWKLSENKFTEKPYNESVLNISQYGYYSIAVKSKHGTSLQLVNKMTGPGQSSGIPGEKDGRLDILLDEGLYKLRMVSRDKVEGSLELSVTPYQEINTPQAPVIQEGKVIETELGDLQQMSWWIEVDQNNQNIYLETQGRNLSKLIVWREGSWVEDIRTITKQVEYETGRPMTSIMLNTTLSKGYYKITVYGGPELKWAEDNKTHPFRLRYGLNQMTMNSRSVAVISPFGVNRYLVDGSADFFLLQAFKKKGYKLKVQSLETGEDFDHYDRLADITEKSSSPQCMVSRSYYNRKILISVEGQPGDRFIVQNLYKSQSMYIRPRIDGDYWLSTVHSGFIEDNIDASGFVVDTYGEDRVVAQDLAVLNSRQGWSRRFNLLQTISLYIQIEQAGAYSFDLDGTEARIKVERFFTSSPRDYVAPDFVKGSHEFKLEKGIHIITLDPVNKGILTLQVRPKGLALGKSFQSPRQANIQIPKITLDKDHSYSFIYGSQGEVYSAIQLRELPLDLRQALTVYLEPGEEVKLPVEVLEPSLIYIQTENEASYTLNRMGQTVQPGQTRLEMGKFDLVLKNTDKNTEMFTLELKSTASLPDSEPRYLSTQVINSFPKFETIQADSPVYFDLGYNEKKIFLLEVKKAGIYRVQSVGRLQTKASMRDRITPSLGSAQANGLGRNFLLQSYLKEGIYQIQVEVMGRSAGHLGVLLEYLPPVDGGNLVLGKYQKATVPAGNSLIYMVNVGKEQQYAIRTLGMDREYPCRFEDSEGYPLLRPGLNTDLKLDLFPGKYRLISLPQEVEGKRLTLFSQEMKSEKPKGKGPIALEWNNYFNNTWKESEGERFPDVYTFQVPAKMPVTFSIDNHMWGRLFLLENGKKKPVRDLYSDKNLNLELASGAYRLEMFARRVGNQQNYNVRLSTEALADGMSYTFSPSRVFDVYVGEDAQVEFSTIGKVDVTAELYDAQGRLLEKVDDSPHDWNFILSAFLKAGKYKLRIDSNQGSYGSTQLTMKVLKTLQGPALLSGQPNRIDMAGSKKLMPLPQGGGYYHLRADAGSQFALSMVEKSGGQWLEKAIVEGQDYDWFYYIPSGNAYQMAFWSLDHIDEEINIFIDPFTSSGVTLDALQKGFVARPEQGLISLKTEIQSHSTYRVECQDPADGSMVERVLYVQTITPQQPAFWNRVQNKQISVAPGTLCLNIPSEKPLRIQITEIKLEKDKPWGITTYKQDKFYYRLNGAQGDVQILVAEGSTGQPLVSFIDPKGDLKFNDNTRVSSAFSFHNTSALAVSMGSDQKYAAAWNPIKEVEDSGIRLTWKSFALGKLQLLEGPSQGQIPAGKLLAWNGIEGITWEIALDPGMVVFSWNDKGIKEVHYTAFSPGVFTVKGSRLAIAAYKQEGGNYTLRPVSNREENSTSSVMLETVATRPGFQLTDRVVTDNGNVVFAGPEIRVSVLDSSGDLHQSTAWYQPEILPGFNRILMEYPVGQVKVWNSTLEMPEAGKWGQNKKPAAKNLTQQGTVSLSEPAWYKLPVKTDSVLRITSPQYVVSALESEGKITRVKETAPGESQYFLVPRKGSLLGLRSWGENIPYSAEISWTEIQELDKAGKTSFVISDGGMQAFHFRLDSEQEIALGYQAPTDLIYCSLFDNSGQLIKEGPVLFTTLKTGDYFVVYSLRPEITMAAFTPVYVNTSSIETQILNDQVKAFLIKYGYLKGNE